MNTKQNKPEKNVANTSGRSYFGRGLKEDKALGTRFYGNCIVVGIHPQLPTAAQTTNSKYDYKAGTIVYLTDKVAKGLAKLIRKAIEAKAAGERVRSKGVTCSNSLIEVGFGDKYNLDADKLCIAIYDVNENKAAANKDVFEFGDDIVIVDYDERGTYEHELVGNDIERFVEQLEDFSKAMGNGTTHAIKVDWKWSMDRIMDRQIQTMNALGIVNNTATSKTDWTKSPSSSSSTQSGQRTYAQSSEDLANELADMYN